VKVRKEAFLKENKRRIDRLRPQLYLNADLATLKLKQRIQLEEVSEDTEIHNGQYYARTPPIHIHHIETQDGIRIIKQKLADTPSSFIQPLYKKKAYQRPAPRNTSVIDIAAISAVGIHYNLIQKNNEAFYTSLYKIDRQLKENEKKRLFAIYTRVLLQL